MGFLFFFLFAEILSHTHIISTSTRESLRRSGEVVRRFVSAGPQGPLIRTTAVLLFSCVGSPGSVQQQNSSGTEVHMLLP